MIFRFELLGCTKFGYDMFRLPSCWFILQMSEYLLFASCCVRSREQLMQTALSGTWPKQPNNPILLENLSIKTVSKIPVGVYHHFFDTKLTFLLHLVFSLIILAVNFFKPQCRMYCTYLLNALFLLQCFLMWANDLKFNVFKYIKTEVNISALIK